MEENLFTKIDLIDIKQALSNIEKHSESSAGYIPSAVLLPLYEKAGDLHLVFIKRTETVQYHKGQISFPGGRHQPEDGSLLETALRESWEEIGLEPRDAEILGELDDIATYTTNFVISPYVAAIPYPYQFRPSPEEVEEIIEVPLTVLLNGANYSEEEVYLGDQCIVQHFYRYGDRVIYGATARILKQFLEIAFGVEG
jgi:8-oxo-dGTP pyrophosphatase MutT (NUDIX family)